MVFGNVRPEFEIAHKKLGAQLGHQIPRGVARVAPCLPGRGRGQGASGASSSARPGERIFDESRRERPIALILSTPRPVHPAYRQEDLKRE